MVRSSGGRTGSARQSFTRLNPAVPSVPGYSRLTRKSAPNLSWDDFAIVLERSSGGLAPDRTSVMLWSRSERWTRRFACARLSDSGTGRDSAVRAERRIPARIPIRRFRIDQSHSSGGGTRARLAGAVVGSGKPDVGARAARAGARYGTGAAALAAEQLGAVNESWACDELLALLKDTIPEVRDTAREALRKQGAVAVGVLVKALEHADPKIAVPAADMLAELQAAARRGPSALARHEVRVGRDPRGHSCGWSATRRRLCPRLQWRQDPDPWTRMRSEEILADIRATLPAPAPMASEAPP